MVVVFGEVLFDHFPGYRKFGGAPFNFAYHLKQLGVDVRFISRVGDDEPGREILKILTSHGFDAGDIQIDKKLPTGYVTIELDEKGIPEYDIVKNTAYDNITLDDTVKGYIENDHTEMVYYGTLVQRSAYAKSNFEKIFQLKSGQTKGFYDINLRPECYNKSIIENSLKATNIFKINDEELFEMEEMFQEEIGQSKKDGFIEYIFQAFPIEVIILTKGEAGSEFITKDSHFRVDSRKPEKIGDTVGAGDAFASVIAFGILNNLDLKKTGEMASVFASYVCENTGAIPADMGMYSKILSGDFS